MGKKDELYCQHDMFPFDPEIRGISVVDVRLKGGLVEVDIVAATECRDLAMMDPGQWARAVAEWLVRLAGGDLNKAEALLLDAHGEFCQEANAREADEAMGYARRAA